MKIQLPPRIAGERLALEARLVADTAPVLQEKLLTGRHDLILTTVLRCGETRWSQVIDSRVMPCNTNRPPLQENITIPVDLNRVRGKFHLAISLCLGADRNRGKDLQAWKKLHVLAEKRFTILPGGTGGRITEWVSFSEKGLPPGVSCLHLKDNDLDQPASSIRLWLNKDSDPLRKLLSSTALPQPEIRIANGIAIRFIQANFLKDLLLLAFFTPEKDCPLSDEEAIDSCWDTVFRACRFVFPDSWDEEHQLESFRKICEQYSKQPELIGTHSTKPWVCLDCWTVTGF